MNALVLTCRLIVGIAGPGVCDLIGALFCTLRVLSCVRGAEVILGVDAHLDIVRAVPVSGCRRSASTMDERNFCAIEQHSKFVSVLEFIVSN